MRNPTHNNRGTTLVELIVCMALLGLFSVAIVALIQPCAKAFSEMQQLARAQNLADSVIERVRGEVLQASDFVRITNGATVGNEGDIFKMEQSYGGAVNPAQGSAIEFGLESGYIELIDAGSIATTELTARETFVSAGPPEVRKTITAKPGYMHLRYYKFDTEDTARISDYAGYTWPPKHEDGTKEIAYNYTEAFPQNNYMNMTVELQFTVHGHTPTTKTYPSGTLVNDLVNSIVVQVVVYDNTDPTAPTPICSQKAIVTLPHEPMWVVKKA